MSRRREAEREEERRRLLAEIDAAKVAEVELTSDQWERVSALVAEDIARTWSGQSVDARSDRILAGLLRDLLASSDVRDVEPLSLTPTTVDGGTEFFVVSRSRGRVSIGTLPYKQVRAETAEVLPLPRGAAAAVATGALTHRTGHRVRRTAELTAQGMTARQIGEKVASEEGYPEPFPISTVRGWRRQARRHKG